MTTRSRRETITFLHPFRINGIDRLLRPGTYEVITDEEMIEGLSVPAASWPEAAAKARYIFNLYTAGLGSDDTHHRDLVTAVLADFDRLSIES